MLKNLLMLTVLSILIAGCSSSPERSYNTYNYTETRSASFSLNTSPQGAKVYLENQFMGETPTSVSYTYTYQRRGYSQDETRSRFVKIEKEGYEPFSFSFDARNKQYSRYNSKYIKLKPSIDDQVSITGAAQGLKRVTSSLLEEKVLELSPDKKWLLIEISEKGKRNKTLQKINLSKGIRVLLTQQTSSSIMGRWLPNMSGYVFSTNRLGKYTLAQSLGVSGEAGVRFITNTSLGNAIYPSISPNGKEIAFTIKQGRQNQLAIINTNGKNLRMYGNGLSPCWSPNGKNLVFSRKVGKFYHLFLMNPDSGTEIIQLSSELASDKYPVWSPKGDKIAFISDRVNGRRHIFIMDKNGQNVTQVTEGFYDVSSVEWGKDGYIYFSANAGGNLDIWKIKIK